MSVLDTAKEQVKNIKNIKNIVEKVAEKTGPHDSRTQALTIARQRSDVMRFFTDSEHLAQAFGDFADVQSAGDGRLRWTFLFDGGGPAWDCVVATDGDNRLRFVDVNPQHGTELTLDFRDAPQGRGTEVTARISSPAPGMFTGALAYQGLYRARAVMQTGEAPTLKHNPSARSSAKGS